MAKLTTNRVHWNERKERSRRQDSQQTTIKLVDDGWRQFWLARGKKTPPHVSATTIGFFSLK